MSAMPVQATRRIWLVLLSALFASGATGHRASAGTLDELPNHLPFLNEAGTAATFSTAGAVDLNNEFHLPQGSNGRSCGSCHLIQAGWSIRPVDVELKFLLTRGTDPIFNLLDANSPNADLSPAARRASFSMLRKGLFRRGGAVLADAEYEVIAVDDPIGSGGSSARFTVFRRPLATANFHIAMNVGWHDQDTDGMRTVDAGLVSQAANNITGAQQGRPPADPDIVRSIVTYEEGLRFAQQSVFGVGLLTSCGAQGGPENLSAQPAVRGRFTLYDAWIGLIPGTCTTKSADRKRAQIARGQELFNRTKGGRSCNFCHDASNNGSNVSGRLFDVGASALEFRAPDLPLYTLRNKTTLEVRATTDPGRALRSGHWADLDRFKTPSLRGLAARAPYFHNGIATTLKDVVLHYEAALGFEFTPQEREDLVAFLQAL